MSNFETFDSPLRIFFAKLEQLRRLNRRPSSLEKNDNRQSHAATILNGMHLINYWGKFRFDNYFEVLRLRAIFEI